MRREKIAFEERLFQKDVKTAMRVQKSFKFHKNERKTPRDLEKVLVEVKNSAL